MQQSQLSVCFFRRAPRGPLLSLLGAGLLLTRDLLWDTQEQAFCLLLPCLGSLLSGLHRPDRVSGWFAVPSPVRIVGGGQSAVLAKHGRLANQPRTGYFLHPRVDPAPRQVHGDGCPQHPRIVTPRAHQIQAQWTRQGPARPFFHQPRHQSSMRPRFGMILASLS